MVNHFLSKWYIDFNHPQIHILMIGIGIQKYKPRCLRPAKLVPEITTYRYCWHQLCRTLFKEDLKWYPLLEYCDVLNMSKVVPGIISSVKRHQPCVHVCRSVIIQCNRTYSLRSHADSWRINPIEDLQDFVAIPLIKKENYVFNPSPKEIEKGHDLFIEKPGHVIKIVKSVVNLEKLPVQNIPEVSFVGQSNVGKSSLINALFCNAGDPNLIRIGKTPGLTKTLLFYNVGKRLSLVDMPGYGINMPSYYMKSMHTYLKTRRELCRSFLLVDSEQGLTKVDKQGLEMMEDLAKPYAIVMTKIDKPRRSVLVKNLMEVLDHANKHTHICFPQPFLVCAPSLAGIKYLQTFIAHVTGNLQLM